MEKVFSFGKFAVSGNRKINEITIEIEYEKEPKPKFSASAYIWNGTHTDIIQGGQCFDTIQKYLKGNELFENIYGLWKRNHLNDMCPYANKEQKLAVEEYLKENNNNFDYTECCEYLKNRGIFEVVVNGKKCKYGHEWFYQDIEVEDKKMIEELMKS